MPPFVEATLFAAAMLMAWGAGWKWGTRRRGRADGADTGRFNEAILALLGLLLAFTVSMSLGKHEQRRQMMVTDSNAIGDFLTCVQMLEAPHRAPLEAVLRKYVAARLALVEANPPPEEFERRLSALEAMQSEMLAQVGAAIQTGTPVAMPLVLTLNGVTSSHAARLAAYRDRLPGSVVLTLLLAATLSMGMAAYRQGMAGDWRLGGPLGFTLLISLTVGVALDLNQPRSGWIRVSQEPLERLLRSLDS